MKTLLLMLFLVITLFSYEVSSKKHILSEDEITYLKNNKLITFTGDPNWLPFEAFDKDGNYIGIVSDHLTLIEDSFDIKFNKIVSKTWSDALAIAMDGRADIISGDAADKILNQKFNPIDMYIKNPIVIVMNNSNDYIDNLDEIANKKIVIIKDYGYTADIYKNYPNIQFIEVNTIQEGLESIENGQNDAMLASLALVSYNIQKMGLKDIGIVGKTDILMNLTLFINKNEPILFSIIQKGIKNIDPILHQNILKKWRRTEAVVKTDYILIIKILGVMAILFIIVLYRQHEINIYTKKIEYKNKKLEEYTHIIDDNVIISSTDLNAKITYVSKAFCDISGYSASELLQNTHNIVRHPDMPTSIYKYMWETIKQKQVWKGEIKNKRKDGSYYWVRTVITPRYDDEGILSGYTAIRENITDKKIIEEISQRDKLTQLYNRVKLDEILSINIEKAKRYNTGFSVIMLDIDYFKVVNDTHGHLVGDSVLIQVAKLLTKNIRKIDIAGRWGGEEFLIICSSTSIDSAAILAEKIRLNMEEFSFDTTGKLTGSFGVSQYKVGETGNKLLKRCDDALYKAKESGRNQVVLN